MSSDQQGSGSDAALRRELVQLAQGMLFGAVAERGRVCGKPTCHCARGERHPSVQLSYRGPEGKTMGHHVSQPLVEPVREGVAAWHRFQAIARELAERNRVQLWRRARRRGEIR
jgi:hypothetical protein